MKNVKTINPMHKPLRHVVVDEFVRFSDKNIVQNIWAVALVVTLAFLIVCLATEHYTPMWDTPVEYACHMHSTLTLAGLVLGSFFARVIAKLAQKLR